jgi:hypothetical protein
VICSSSKYNCWDRLIPDKPGYFSSLASWQPQNREPEKRHMNKSEAHKRSKELDREFDEVSESIYRDIADWRWKSGSELRTTESPPTSNLRRQKTCE